MEVPNRDYETNGPIGEKRHDSYWKCMREGSGGILSRHNACKPWLEKYPKTDL